MTGLYLVLKHDDQNPTWERECEAVGTTTDEQQYEPDGSHNNLMCVEGEMWQREYQNGKPTRMPIKKTKYTCRQCHGSGKQSVRLVGSVGVKHSVEIDYDVPHIYYKTQIDLHYYCEYVSDSFEESDAGFIRELINLHRSNALPASLYRSEGNPDGLYEEVVP